MHTFKGNKINIFHNGDYSGEIKIINKATSESMEIESEEIFKFVAEYVRSKKIQEVEGMNYNDLLK